MTDTPMTCANDRPGTARTARTASASNKQPSKRAKRREVIFITSIIPTESAAESSVFAGISVLSVPYFERTFARRPSARRPSFPAESSNRELRLFPMPVRLVLVVLGTADADSSAALESYFAEIGRAHV